MPRMLSRRRYITSSHTIKIRRRRIFLGAGVLQAPATNGVLLGGGGVLQTRLGSQRAAGLS